MRSKRLTEGQKVLLYILVPIFILLLLSMAKRQFLGLKVMYDLHNYYGGSFWTTKVEKHKTTSSGGFPGSRYSMEVYSFELDEKIKVTTNSLGSDVNDDYEKYLYGDRLSEEVNSYYAEENGWKLSDVDVKYYEVGDERRGLSYEGYKATGKVLVKAKIDITGSNLYAISDSIYNYIKLFDGEPYKWRVDIYYGGQSYMISQLYSEQEVSKEDLDEGLKSLGI